ncbi:MAG: ATP-binding protein [Bacteroidota bacterium]|nr:ATP-binding protein [Bacteroidota bacterium]
MKIPSPIKRNLRRSVPLPAQYSLSISIFFLLALAGSFLESTIGHQSVALVMLLIMSLLAMVFDIVPVLLAGILSALTWNYFFSPPIYEFNFVNKEDLFLFTMYFIIAFVNVGLSFRQKTRYRMMRDKEEKEKLIVFYNTVLNSLSHELRTPIATIIGCMDAMDEQNGSLTAVHKNELMEEVSTAALRLNQQVENLLGMSRLESGIVKLNLDWTDINELIHRVIHNRHQVESVQSIIFQPGENLPLFKMDAILIEQVILNLLQNAIVYTPDNAEIYIDTMFENGNCKITFRDNGPGFPESSLQTAFDKFYRIGHSNSGGTGLGLSIVKGFVEAHNGSVVLSNNSSGGACFLIEIPAETSFIQNVKNE